jgi:hypothetical protein
MLKPGERNQYNEAREYITAELALLKKLAAMADRFNQRRMRQGIDRMGEGLSMSEEQMKDPWSEIKINPKNLKPEDFERPIMGHLSTRCKLR